MDLRRSLILAGGALVVLLAWPVITAHRLNASAAAGPTPAPVTADYLQRDKLIAFYEAMQKRDKLDGLSPRMLAGQYLQRYRERGDVGDVLRARAAAERSLVANPRGNVSAEVSLSSALVDLHQFRAALQPLTVAEAYGPNDGSLRIREANIQLELGDVPAARTLLDRARTMALVGADLAVAEARYDELTGNLARARHEIERPLREIDSIFDAPAENRAWFHYRAGDLAFGAGDQAAAEAEYRTALREYPGYWHAETSLARLYAGQHRWSDALSAAQQSIAFTPYPDALGYAVDAYRALGRSDEAQRTDDLIAAIARLGNAQHVSDRLLAIYYDEHDVQLDQAYAIAQRDIGVHPDLAGYDTLAWAAAKAGRWDAARNAIAQATRYDSEDAKLQYHAGMIALHFGDRAEAKRRLTRALALNPVFHPAYADAARATLATL